MLVIIAMNNYIVSEGAMCVDIYKNNYNYQINSCVEYKSCPER